MHKAVSIVCIIFSTIMSGALYASGARLTADSRGGNTGTRQEIITPNSLNGNIVVTWKSDPEAISYKIYHNDKPQSPDDPGWLYLATTSDTIYVMHPPPVPAKPRFFLIKAVYQQAQAWAPVITLNTDGTISITSNPYTAASIYYTRDGSTPTSNVYPNSSSLLYDPNAVVRTLIPITIKAVAVDPIEGTSRVSTLLPEDMIRTLLDLELSEIGGQIGNQGTLDSEIAYIKANGLWDKIGYLIGKDFGSKLGTDQSDHDFYNRTAYVGFSFDDGASPATLNTAVQLEAVGARGTFFINSHLVGTNNYITWDDILNPVTGLLARGHVVADHGWTHSVGDPDYLPNVSGIPNLIDLEPKDINNEFYRTDQDFFTHGLTPPVDYAVPIYAIDYQKALPIAAQYRRTIRGYNNIDYNILGDGTGYQQFNWNLYNAYSYASATEAGYQGAISFINGAIAKNGVAFLATHSTDSAWFPMLLNWIASQGIQIKTYPELIDTINSKCTKYINLVKRDYEVIAHMDDFLALPPEKKGLVVFDCQLSELPGGVVEHYQGLGFNIAFWKDQSPEAFALMIPNNDLFLDNISVTLSSNYRIQITGKVGADAKFPTGGTRPGVVLSGSVPPAGLSFGTTYYAQGFGSYIRLYASPTGGSNLTFSAPGYNVKISTIDRFRDKLYAYQCTNPTPADVTNLRCLRNITRLKYPNGTTSQMDINFCGGDISGCGISYFRRLWRLNTSGFLSGEADETMRNIYRGYVITHINGYISSFLAKLMTSGYLPCINYLYLSNNEISESIPADMGKLTNLQVLDLSTNKIFGSIPWQVGGCFKLGNLFLNDNLLNGTIPSELRTAVALIRIRLQNNSISGYGTGAISPGMRNLVEVNVSNNSINSQTQIDQLISDVLTLVRSGGKTTGSLALNGGTNAAPSAAGLANITILQGGGDPMNGGAIYHWLVPHN